jgi:precorrin-6y C5,15-methyltransferase (decarboxylating) CbiE subunit
VITVVGTGVSAAPAEALAGAGLVVGGRRHLDAVAVPVEAERVVLGPLAPALDVIERHLDKGSRVVVLASGDPGFFGIVRVLAERFGAGALDVRPGVSSVAAAFARVGVPWDDAVVVSAHGRDLRTAVNVCRARPKVAVLTGPGAGPAELGAALGGAGEGSRAAAAPSGLVAPRGGAADRCSPAPLGRVLLVASALGTEDERVERVTPAEAATRDWGSGVSVVLCLDESRLLGGVRTVAGPPPAPSRWLRRWVVRGAGWGLVITLLAQVIVGPLLPWFFGEDFRPALPIARVLIVAGGVLALRKLLACLLLGVGVSSGPARAEVAAIVTFLVIASLASGAWGIIGVAWAMLAAGVVACTVMLALLRPHLRTDPRGSHGTA